MPEQPLVPLLRRTILVEILAALGLSPQGWSSKPLSLLFWPPAHLFARLMAGIDRIIGEKGLPTAAGQLLPRFVDHVCVVGRELIPREGPLLIASNHPGAYDVVAILANMPRDDLKLIVSDVPFLHSLPFASQHMIYTPPGAQARMLAVRGIIRHMQQDGAVLIFPSGLVDPDPDVIPGAGQELNKWSPSLDLVMEKVPQTRLLVTIVSGVLAPACLRSPLTRIPKERWQKQKLAVFLQVIQQLVFFRKFDLKPRLSFGEAKTAAELLSESMFADLHQAIIQSALRVLDSHCQPAAI